MKYMEEIKYMLCDELEKIAGQGELTAGSLDMIDKLTHSIKSIEAIEKMHHKEGASRRSEGSYRISYSRYGGPEGEAIEKLENMMAETKDGKVKEAIKSALQHIEE